MRISRITPATRCMLRRTSACGIPVVADSCSDVVVRRLRAVAERQRVVAENDPPPRTHVEQRVERNRAQRFACRRQPLRAEIAADQAGVGLADLDERLARAVMRHADDVEAPVGDALTEDGEVKHLGIESDVNGYPASQLLLHAAEAGAIRESSRVNRDRDRCVTSSLGTANVA